MTVTKSTVEPMLRFITKVTAFEFSEGMEKNCPLQLLDLRKELQKLFAV